MRSTSPRTLLLLAMLTAVALLSCATNPVTGGKDFVLMSEGEEISLGQQYNQEILKEMPAYGDPELAAYVNAVGQRLARTSHRPNLLYHFTVIDSPMVNAFALPGGYVYITRGILAYLNSEAELAAVLGHEIGHVTARHSVRQQSAATVTGVAGAVLGAATGVPASRDLFNVLGKAILSGYGREHELEADRLGAQYLARAGYDPKAMLEVIGVLKNQELYERQRAREEGRAPNIYHGVFASHPANDQRLQTVVGEAAHLKTRAAPRVGRAVYLGHLEGLPYGPSAKEGIVDGNHFYHKGLDLGLDFPSGWSIDNQAERLLAHAPGRKAVIELTSSPRPAGVMPCEYLRTRGARNPQGGAPLTLQGYQTCTALAPVNTSTGVRNAHLVALYDKNQAYLFIGVSARSGTDDPFYKQFIKVVRSIHHLDAREKQLAGGLKLHLVRAGANTRIETLARHSPLGKQAEAVLRLLNDLYPDGEPQRGQTLKIVR